VLFRSQAEEFGGSGAPSFFSASKTGKSAIPLLGGGIALGAGSPVGAAAAGLYGAAHSPYLATRAIGATKGAGKGISATGEKISGLGKRIMPELDDASRMRTQVSSEMHPNQRKLYEQYLKKQEALKNKTAPSKNVFEFNNEQATATYVKRSDKTIDKLGYERDGKPYIMLELIKTNREGRGQGFAGKLLDSSLEEMEKKNMPIRLLANPVDDLGMNQSELVRFYNKHGFESIPHEGESVLMEYQGKPTKIHPDLGKINLKR